jgi:plastocyanin
MRDNLFPAYGTILIVILVLTLIIGGCTTAPQTPVPQETLSPVTTTIQPTAAGEVTIIIENYAFNPPEITIPVGTTVTWLNQDPFDHQVTNDATASYERGAIFRSAPLSEGESYAFIFNTSGTYPYYCAIHPFMKATITVT